MDVTRFNKINSLFDEAIQKEPAERTAFLRSECGDDADLIGEVNSLLEFSDKPVHLIESGAFRLAEALGEPVPSIMGRAFGPYRIIREIGHGGMGAVYLAERIDGEFEQQVALKIVRQGVVSNELERHFRRERQILASLNHPNIARLLDGGVSSAGESYIAMEYVDGLHLTDYAGGLPVESKLRLFAKICDAVSYAHRNLIVHRDLKSSNILVTKDGEPKLLDFGLAKIEEDGLDTKIEITNFRALTPAYASPEQIRGDYVTTSSDIYSLGVVLYELLSGYKPFDFENKSLEQILKTSEQEPTAPSTRNHPLGQEKTTAISVDLDNVVLVALRREPERRYRTVESFALDIRNVLSGFPVSARPNTLNYRFAKFIGRNRVSVIAGVLIALSLCVGAILTAVQYRQAKNERARAESVKSFLRQMLITNNPNASPKSTAGYSTSFNEMLKQAAERLDGEDLKDQPEVKAEIEETLAASFLRQGEYDLSEKYFFRVLQTRAQLVGDDSSELLDTRMNVASILLAKSRYDEAEAIYSQYLPRYRDLFNSGGVEPAKLMSALNEYALLKRARGDSKHAETIFRESVVIGSNGNILPAVLNEAKILLALTLLDQGKFAESESDVRELVTACRQTQPAGTVELANDLTLLGSILMEQGKLKEARTDLIEAKGIFEQFQSPNSLNIHDNLRLQAQVSYLLGEFSVAEKQIDAVLDNYRRNSSPKYISFATALTIRGLILSKLGKYRESEETLRDAVKLRTENLPPGHFMTALSKGALGEVLTSEKKFAEAETLLTESFQDLKTSQADANERVTAANQLLLDLSKARRSSDTVK